MINIYIYISKTNYSHFKFKLKDMATSKSRGFLVPDELVHMLKARPLIILT